MQLGQTLTGFAQRLNTVSIVMITKVCYYFSRFSQQKADMLSNIIRKVNITNFKALVVLFGLALLLLSMRNNDLPKNLTLLTIKEPFHTQNDRSHQGFVGKST